MTPVSTKLEFLFLFMHFALKHAGLVNWGKSDSVNAINRANASHIDVSTSDSKYFIINLLVQQTPPSKIYTDNVWVLDFSSNCPYVTRIFQLTILEQPGDHKNLGKYKSEKSPEAGMT